MNSSEKIVFNSAVLYAKLVITILVNLIATRLILNAMGVKDYGIVNLISGIVSMLTFVQNSMAVSTQRYMSVNLGAGDSTLQKRIFNNGLFLHTSQLFQSYSSPHCNPQPHYHARTRVVGYCHVMHFSTMLDTKKDPN